MFRFACPVFPSEDDDVVTSPYNAALAASVLVESAHCVLPLENQALAAISSRLEATASSSINSRGGAAAAGSSRGGRDSSSSMTANLAGKGGGSSAAAGKGGGAGSSRGGWDTMNGLAASLLLHLTSSIRFEGTLNTDLNDITMNLVG